MPRSRGRLAWSFDDGYKVLAFGATAQRVELDPTPHDWPGFKCPLVLDGKGAIDDDRTMRPALRWPSCNRTEGERSHAQRRAGFRS
jgi:hypothetical protein